MKKMRFPSRLRSSASLVALLVGFVTLAACSPTYDWREVRGPDTAFVALLPAKPDTHSRPINLDGLNVVMTMMGAEVEGVTFAIGTVPLPDPATVQPALNAMKTAMVRNIGGTVRKETTITVPGATLPAIEIEAVGKGSARSGGQPLLLAARFVASKERVTQILVLGPEKSVSREAVDTFLTSFRLN